jgi:hypothetical protein
MEAMPGMAPAGLSTTKSSGEAPAKKDMNGVSKMGPKGGSEKKDMGAMPGMKAGGKPGKKDRSAMPGMGLMGGAQKKTMGAMPGMSSGAPAPQRMSAPGIFGLLPPQEWTAPSEK